MTDADPTDATILPLAGVRVLDFSRLLPGPFATRMLAEFGADVVKVEQPGTGDPSRHSGPRHRDGASVYFTEANAGKRTIALDLTREEGRAVARDLIAGADVMVESSRAGGAAKLGLDYATARAANPGIIHCSITGFGQTGPLSHIAGHDLVIQAMTGVLGMAPDAAALPALPGMLAADFAGGLYAAIAIQAALARRARGGGGGAIDLAMFDALFSMGTVVLSQPLARAGGGSGEPRIEVFGANPRYAAYRSRDGRAVAVALLETRAWRAFCASIGRPDLAPEHERPEDRLGAHGPRAEEYRAALAAFCGERTWAEIMAHVERTGIAICPICSPEDAAALPHAAARGLVALVDDGAGGAVARLANPLARAGLARAPQAPAPAPGADTDAILAETGRNGATIAALRRAGVIGD